MEFAEAISKPEFSLAEQGGKGFLYEESVATAFSVDYWDRSGPFNNSMKPKMVSA